MKADVLFNNMKQNKNYFAVVVDEYGGNSGIITIHDLLELLVGDMDDKVIAFWGIIPLTFIVYGIIVMSRLVKNKPD